MSKRNAYTSAAYTADFSREFEAETQRLLRRRFLWFTAFVALIGALGLVLGLVGSMAASRMGDQYVSWDSSQTWKIVAVGLPWTLLYVLAFAWVIYDKPKGKMLINASILVVAIDGLLNIVGRVIDMPGGVGLAGFGISHLIAALFLPWTPAQAMRPAIYVLVINALVKLGIEYPFWTLDGAGWFRVGMQLLFSPLIAVPGTLVAALRHSRRTQSFKMKFFQSRYGDLRRELVDAKRIHESLFPESIADGPVVLSYTYEPARAIGGDFLFVHRTPGEKGDANSGSISLAVIDVTGHGIPAALTVNRLHGELTRIFAEEPDASPGEVLRLVNRYVHLTLASHSIYATGFCARVHLASQTLEYASAGHPPAFIRGVDGTIEDLNSTAIVLGAAPAEAFESGQTTVRFCDGDALLAYTDGAIEARSANGTMFRIEGLRKAIALSGRIEPGEWPAHLRTTVEDFRMGAADDDMLIVELRRAIRERVKARPMEMASRST